MVEILARFFRPGLKFVLKPVKMKNMLILLKCLVKFWDCPHWDWTHAGVLLLLDPDS